MSTTRTPDYDPAPVRGGLPRRTVALLARFDAEPDKGLAFCDSGDGLRYATWMADLLDEWLDGFRKAADDILNRMEEPGDEH